MPEHKCPHCGHKNQEGAKFCSECGAPRKKGVKNTAGSAGHRKKQQGSTALRDSLIIVGVLAVAVIGYFLFRDAPEPPQSQQPRQQSGATGQGAMTANMLDQLPKDYNTLVTMGNQFMDEGNWAVAAEIYRRALEIDGSDPNVRTDYGACLHGMGLPERALEQFSTVISNHPTHGIAHFNSGIVHYTMDNPDSALVYFEKYLALEPQGRAAESARQYVQQLKG